MILSARPGVSLRAYTTRLAQASEPPNQVSLLRRRDVRQFSPRPEMSADGRVRDTRKKYHPYVLLRSRGARVLDARASDGSGSHNQITERRQD